MTKVKPTTKEQLVYYLIQNVSLGTYDRRFLTNLQSIQVRDKQPATSNQSALLDKITLRYSKQLRRQEIDADDMVKLPWNIEPIDSIPEYTDAFCEIKDGIIEVRSPYKKEFITEIKKTELNLKWEKETKIWSAPLCEYTLKHFIDCLDKHYQIVHYCPACIDIINTLADYESATCWNPTYKNVNGNYMIAAINKSVNEVLGDVPMNLDASTLARLTAAGVAIDDEIKTEACIEMWETEYAVKLVDFATKNSFIESIDALEHLATMVKDIGADFVIIVETFSNRAATHTSKLMTYLEQNNVAFLVVDKKMDPETIDIKQYEFPVIINTALWGSQRTGNLSASKTICLGNNKLIEIK